mmetsp:Transcript_130581/g.251637  ORF Transcript_130581/g.251637 Transcript_130581/m.251637 type:complete len:100 (-) Transcript_130581:38-337(-)
MASTLEDTEPVARSFLFSSSHGDGVELFFSLPRSDSKETPGGSGKGRGFSAHEAAAAASAALACDVLLAPLGEDIAANAQTAHRHDHGGGAMDQAKLQL